MRLDTYITHPDELQALITRDRLTPVLVRYRGVTEGRFTAPAQDVPDLLAMLEATNRYPRDLSHP